MHHFTVFPQGTMGTEKAPERGSENHCSLLGSSEKTRNDDLLYATGEHRPPTQRQLSVLRAVQSHVHRFGFPPTIREIAHEVGITSKNGVVLHLKALEERGLIDRSVCRSRSLRVTGAGDEALRTGEVAPLRAKKAEPRRTGGLVYVIEAEGAGRVKIGFTTGTAEERCRGLRVGSAFPLRILATFPGSRFDETRLHHRFRKLRVAKDSEWFVAGPSLVEFLRANGVAIEVAA